MSVKYITNIHKLEQLSAEEAKALAPVTEKFVFRTNSYYNTLINWADPNDPLRRLIIPGTEELVDWGELDASKEKLYQPVPGLEHKYKSTALLLCNDVCAAYCRFCFRKRLFQNDNDEVVKDVTQGIAYIKAHPEIDNVLLTGGDPLIMSTGKLENIILRLCEIDHVKNIRIGTKIPAFNPFRILDDPLLPDMIERYTAHKQIYIMAHFNHPVEFTDVSKKALKTLTKAGAAVVNQTPIIRGVNDSAEVLRKLFNQLSYIGIQSYYVFVCRPTEGNKEFAVPIEEAYSIFEKAIANNSGLAKTAKFIMSHSKGKIEVIGMNEDVVFLKNHNRVESSRNGEIMMFNRNPEAYWLEDYENTPVVALSSL